MPGIRLLVSLLVLSVAVLTACSSSSTTVPTTATSANPAAAGQTPILSAGALLVSQRCTVCHETDRIKAAKKTPEEWKSTVERMVGKGASLNAQEKDTAVKYLSDTYK